MSAGERSDPMPGSVEHERSGSSAEPVTVPVTWDLHRLRRFVATSDAAACLSRERLAEFVFAINEVATNALKYGAGPRWLAIWRTGRTLVGEVSSPGLIGDSVGFRPRPPASAVRGRGLWLVDQLCDAVELQRTNSGTTVRMQVHCS